MPRPRTLSYALNKKTDKLLKVYRQKATDLAVMIPVGLAAALLWGYFLGNMDYYMESWFSLHTAALSRVPLPSWLEAAYFRILLTTTAIFGCMYAFWNKHNEKYKKYKKEILKILEVDPCEHRSACTCKDDYCRWLEKEEGVDLL